MEVQACMHCSSPGLLLLLLSTVEKLFWHYTACDAMHAGRNNDAKVACSPWRQALALI
jgi:hypothetical protein